MSPDRYITLLISGVVSRQLPLYGKQSEPFYTEVSPSANRYDANQDKAQTANLCVPRKVEANTEMFTRQPY